MNWTNDQQIVISDDSGRDILVSAAAGSGKTAVMTQRILQRALSGKADLEHVLVMTFTDQAAGSMRERIERSFREALRLNIASGGSLEERSRLNQQLVQLKQAQVSTIHAYCWKILQNYSSELTDSSGEPLFEAGFGVLDDTRRQLLLDQAADEVLDFFFELAAGMDRAELSIRQPGEKISHILPSHDEELRPFNLLDQEINLQQWLEDFVRTCDIFSDNRNDSKLRELLISQLGLVRSMSDYEVWIRSHLSEAAKAAADFNESREQGLFLDRLRIYLDLALDGLELIQGCTYYEKLMSPANKVNEDLVFRAALERQSSHLHEIKRLLRSEEAGLWDLICGQADRIGQAVQLARRGIEKKELAIIYNSYVLPVIHMLTGTPSVDKFPEALITNPIHVFGAAKQQIEYDLRQMLPVMARFFELVLLIDKAYLRLKIEEKAIDFGDFEHFALQLLRQEPIRNFYRDQFKEIYLDEYQDTNNIQEAIIRQIACGNVFMVGDIKQSIYRFRHANPSLFAEKANLYRDYSELGTLMTLNMNFRSVPGIIEGVNRIFRAFLTRESGEIEYDRSQMLTAGRSADSYDTETAVKPAVSLLLVNVKEQDSVFDADILEDESAEKEALAVVYQIKKLIGEKTCEYKDIAILGRTNKICEIFYSQLNLFGIPVSAAGEREFLDSPELRMLESLMQLLDNMQQDIPLAALMRSGLARESFSENDLIMIRNHDLLLPEEARPDPHFYAAVFRYESNGPDQALRAKLQSFLGCLRRWREYERFMSLSELIGMIYEESGYLNRVSGLAYGRSRVEDLERFREWADDFERTRQRGLFSFVAYIRKIKEKSIKNIGFDPVVTQDNAVRIMTVHSSKGLEFPVVFLAGISQNMIRNEQNELLKVSEQGGITSMAVDVDLNESHMTASHYWHSIESEAADRAEAYRLLYVGMTRAQDRLFLSGRISVSAKGSPSIIRLIDRFSEYSQAGKALPAVLVSTTRSWLELLLLALLFEKNLDFTNWFMDGSRTAEAGTMTIANDCFELNWYEAGWLRELLYPGLPGLAADDSVKTLPVEEAASASGIDRLQVERWKHLLFHEYKYQAAVRQAGKISVSGLKRLQDLQLASDPETLDISTEDTGREDPVWNDTLRTSEVREINLELREPSLTANSKYRLKGAALGSLLHSLFQFIDFGLDASEYTGDTIRKQIIKMAERRIINPNHLEQALQWIDALYKFINSDLAAKIREAENMGTGQVFREIPFTMSAAVRPKTEMTDVCDSGLLESETIAQDENSPDLTLVQGVIDCWFRTAQGVILVDFKSDYLNCGPEDYASVMIGRYAFQLDCYARAIEKATGEKVISRIIWLIRYARAIEC